MVPVRLILRNFLSYRDTTEVDFSGIHLACLSGDNGHGKSALLDAITWALWGKARTDRDDELVHLGQTEMEVELEFDHGPDRYRVLRKRRKGGGGRTGSSALELQALAPPDEWRSLTGNTVTETQRKIIELLRLDYVTFINSAFLVQGRADEFTTQPPGERKRVLGEILGLGYYEQLSERAKAEARLRESRTTALRTEIDLIDRQTAELPQLREELAQTRIELAEAEESRRTFGERYEELREAKRLADLQAEQLRAATVRAKEAQDALARLERELAAHEAEIARHEAIIARADGIERGYAALQAAKSDEGAYGQRAARALQVQERRHTLEQAIAMAKQRTESELVGATREIERLQGLADGIDALRDERARLEGLRADAAALGGRLCEKREQAAAAREQAQGLEASNTALRAAMDDLRRKLDELAAADAICPLCARPLGAEEKARVQATYGEQGSANARDFRQNQERLKAVRAESEGLEGESAATEAQRQEQERHVVAQVTLLDQRWQEASQASTEVPVAQERAAVMQRALNGGSFAGEAQVALRALLAEAGADGYEPAQHQALRSRIAEAAAFEEEHQALSGARALVTQAGASRDRTLADREQWQRRCAEAEGEIAALGLPGAGPDLGERLARAEQQSGEAEARANRTRQALGAVENRVEEGGRLLAGREPTAARLRTAAEEQKLYEELTTAFGKRGVQALLIDAALPELTEEANRLLQRMTLGRMSVDIMTQRATQGGGMAETLDIRIADELGTRPYETYSGGEAFRVDFALRIALSRLLARRAGAPLPTLIIDEGFGTQDANGRERLVEAITAIQDDFRMVLVITHIDELRDVFPHRINVTKTARGSQVEVL